MTIAELYNVLEKYIDSGEATLNSGVYFMKERARKGIPIIQEVNASKIDSDGDLILAKYDAIL